MTDILIKKSKWFDFANEHNKNVTPDATLLNGSDSYTLVAKYLAAGKAIPLSVRLDTARAKGVADHFNGLRQFFEFGKESNVWIKRLCEEFRRFAVENSLNGDEFIRTIIKLTDRSLLGTGAYRYDTPPIQTHTKTKDDAFLPTKEEFESAYRKLVRPVEGISIDAVLDQIETNANNKSLTLPSNWRMITEKNIEIWSKKG